MRAEDFEKELASRGPGVHLVIEERGGIVEAIHRVHAAVVDPSGRLLYRSGDPDHFTFTRSCIKPIQAVPVLSMGAAERYGFTDEEIAVISGSHSGQKEHLALVRSILRKAGLKEKMLKCGPHAPFHKPTAKALKGEPLPIHNNCSGKHASILALSKMMGWSLEDYLEVDHPVQREIIGVISSLTGTEPEAIGVGSDGCGVPNYAIPLRQMAHLFALLGDPSGTEYESELSRIKDSMLSHPFLVAGTDRFDTLLMEDLPGKLITKAGAQGIQATAVHTGKRWVGIAIKIEDGKYDAIGPISYHILEELGISIEGVGAEKYKAPIVKNTLGSKVGNVSALGRFKGKD